MDGFLLVDKPEGWTSRKAMNVIQRRLGLRGGYEGTLDPFASGLLVVGLGKATRFLRFFHVLLKEYVATLKLGEETDTLDPEGEVVSKSDVPQLNLDDVREVAKGFVGDIDQIPPKFSALRLKGKRAYDLARRGGNPDLKPRKVHIEKLEILGLEKDKVHFRCLVGSGTYVRALGRDLAKALGTSGHLIELRRTAIGVFRVEDAKHPEKVEAEDILPMDETLYWMGKIFLKGRPARLFSNGGKIKAELEDGTYRVYADGRFVGIGKVVRGILKAERLI